MDTSGAFRLIWLAIPCLAIAVYPTGIGEALAVLGMDARAARIAGSRLAVMMSLCGAGFMVLGFTSLTRTRRLRRISAAHVGVLDFLSGQARYRAHLVDGVGAGLTAEFDGLPMEVLVEPERGGKVCIRALSMPSQPLTVWPRGLIPEGEPTARQVVASGRAWECWAATNTVGIGSADLILNRAFEDGGVIYLRHEQGGLELVMPNGPSKDLLERIRVGVQAVSVVARLNQ